MLDDKLSKAAWGKLVSDVTNCDEGGELIVGEAPHITVLKAKYTVGSKWWWAQERQQLTVECIVEPYVRFRTETNLMQIITHPDGRLITWAEHLEAKYPIGSKWWCPKRQLQFTVSDVLATRVEVMDPRGDVYWFENPSFIEWSEHVRSRRQGPPSLYGGGPLYFNQKISSSDLAFTEDEEKKALHTLFYNNAAGPTEKAKPMNIGDRVKLKDRKGTIVDYGPALWVVRFDDNRAKEDVDISLLTVDGPLLTVQESENFALNQIVCDPPEGTSRRVWEVYFASVIEKTEKDDVNLGSGGLRAMVLARKHRTFIAEYENIKRKVLQEGEPKAFRGPK